MQNEAKEAVSITALALNEMRDDMEHTNAQLQKELQESVKKRERSQRSRDRGDRSRQDGYSYSERRN
jgi:hypothetical protein